MTIDKFQCVLPGNFRTGTLLLAVFSLALSGLLFTSDDAHAKKKQSQGFFNFFDAPPPARSYRVYGKRRKAKPARSSDESKTAKAKSEERKVKGPLVLTISLAKQRVTVHDIDGPVAEAPISSGNAAYPTLQGVFSILEKSKVHYSNLYAGASMPNMQRLTWSGTAMHAGHLPGYPASHGCIRLPHNFSKKLYGMTNLGTRVLVTRDPIAPVPISHANLIAPLPPEQTQQASISSEAKVAEQRDYETVRSLTLITTASAGELETSTLTAPPLTGYRAKRAAEKQRVEDARATAESAKIDAELAAKDAVDAANTAKEAAKAANIEAARLANELKKAEQLRASGDKALEAFARKFDGGKVLRADEHLKAAQTEKELEDKTFELGRNVESARLAAESAQATADRSKAAVAEAVGKVKRQANVLSDVNKDLKQAEATLASFARQEKVRKQPVSVLISRSAKRLFVRQGYVPIFDIPIAIKDADVAIGTHVFTALELTGPTDMRWSATSIPYKSRPESNSKKKRRNADYDIAPESDHLPQTPESALDRVSIPDDARERIADVMKPGSSVIISDYGISHQTGEFTDFIILTR